MLGDVTHDDATYAGETGDSVLSLQYYRNKATEFQAVMTGVDQTRAGLEQMLAQQLFDDDGTAEEIQLLLSDLDAHRNTFYLAAEAVNGASATLNAMGLRFPQVSMPQGLGAVWVPVVAGVVAVVAAAVAYGMGWMVSAKDVQLRAAQAITDPARRDEALALVAKTDTAIFGAQNPLSSFAGIVKWGAILVGGFVIYKMIRDFRRG